MIFSSFKKSNIVFLHPGYWELWLGHLFFFKKGEKSRQSSGCSSADRFSPTIVPVHIPSVLTRHNHTVYIRVSPPQVKMIRLCSVGCLLHSLEPWPPCPPETSSGRSGNPVEMCQSSHRLSLACPSPHLWRAPESCRRPRQRSDGMWSTPGFPHTPQSRQSRGLHWWQDLAVSLQATPSLWSSPHLCWWSGPSPCCLPSEAVCRWWNSSDQSAKQWKLLPPSSTNILVTLREPVFVAPLPKPFEETLQTIQK